MVRIVVIDEQQRIRRGLQMILDLEADLEIVGETDNGAAMVQLVERLQPDVVVLDIATHGVNSLAAIQELKRRRPACVVVVLSLRDDLETRTQAQAAGAAAFVSKHDSPDVLVATIRRLCCQ